MDDDQLLKQPVVVVGSARSGTTILGQFLDVHSQLHGLQEPRLTWRFGNDRGSDMLAGHHARPEVIAHIRAKFAAQVRAAGRTRLLEKTPSNALRLEFVDRVLPDCKIIHVIRNGVDSSLSIRSFWKQSAHGMKTVAKGRLGERLRELEFRRLPFYAAEATRRFAPKPLSRLIGGNLWGPRIPGLRQLVRELELLEVCALQWRTCVESARHYGASMPSDRYREVHLEDFNTDTFRELLDFAELPAEPVVIENFAAEFRADRATYRKSDASPEDLELLRRWITPTMQWLGYPESFLT